MAVIKAFQAVRPKKGLEQLIAALPYDVYNRQEAKAAVQGAPLSFLNIDRAETGLADTVDIYSDEVYERAASLYQQRKAEGSFIKEEKPCYYLYELTMDGRTQTGIVGCASIDDYTNGVIKKHENTRADKEQDRIRHVDTLSAQTGPIFLAYRKNQILSQIIDETKKKDALYDFTSEDGIRHRVFLIDDAAQIELIEKTFAQIQQIYIADGHHRCASAVKVGYKRREENKGYTGKEEFNYFLSVLFPDEELVIMDYNRVVKDLNGLSKEVFLEKLREKYAVSELEEEKAKTCPKQKGTTYMYLDDQWYQLVYDEEKRKNDPVEGLDVSVLQQEVLAPILGILDPKTDKRIDFVGGIRGMEELKRRVHTDCAVAFAMHPTSIQELFTVADAQKLMPPKSTWFEPKLRSGLFIHEI